MWPTKSVEVWDWELSPTADRKVRGVFQNATSQPVFRCDLCDFLDNIELMCSSPRVWDQNARNILLVFTILCMPSLCFIVINLCHNFIYLFIYLFFHSFFHLFIYCHTWKRDYHCSIPGCETESHQGRHEDQFISSQQVYPQGCRPGTCNPFTLKIMTWNELSSKYWLPGPTWGFVLKFKKTKKQSWYRIHSTEKGTIPPSQSCRSWKELAASTRDWLSPFSVLPS